MRFLYISTWISFVYVCTYFDKANQFYFSLLTVCNCFLNKCIKTLLQDNVIVCGGWNNVDKYKTSCETMVRGAGKNKKKNSLSDLFPR